MKDIFHKSEIVCGTLDCIQRKVDLDTLLRMVSPNHLCKTPLPDICMVLVLHKDTALRNHPMQVAPGRDFS